MRVLSLPLVPGAVPQALHRAALTGAMALLAVLLAAPALAQWSDDPAHNLTIADHADGQTQPKLAPTDEGGFFVSWFGGTGFDVYLQRLDADGYAQWEAGGIRVADRSFSSTEDYGLSTDSEGNALLVFRYPDASELPQATVNRVTPEGELLWGTPGIAASDDPAGIASPRIAGTTDGGAVVAWTSLGTGQIVLQKLDAEGVPQWGPDGVTVALPSGLFFLADLHADAEGNVIVSGSAQLSFFDRQLWAQKLAAADGAPLWGSEPVVVFDGSDGVLQLGYFPTFVPDGNGGAIFPWYQIGVSDMQARVQHVLADGSLAFPQNGVDVTAGTDRQQGPPAAAYDAASGDIYVVWPEERQVGMELTFGVAAQRIDATGTRQWGDSGVPLVPMGDLQASQITALPAPDGAIFTWSLGSFPTPMRIEAARLNADGSFAWPDEVVALKTAATTNARLQGALSTQGFAAYVWSDGANDIASEFIKAQNVRFDGELGPIEGGGEAFVYLYDDGDGDTNVGPPSSFDPDMLWGNYYLTQPGGEVITHISVAFGPTFPSLENGPVTFWLLDDPDMDFDPRNATSLTSVQATPDVFNDTFFTVEIPPTRVSGAFFVGASAKLLGGEDKPAREDWDAPGDKSWFFYAPEIADVIDDLASAPYGTRMDGPDVIFPGAFMIRATGRPASNALLFDPDTLAVTLDAGATATQSVTLTNTSDAPVAFTFTQYAGDAPRAEASRSGDAPPFVTAVTPASGTIPAGASLTVEVTFDATDLAADTYEGALTVETDEIAGAPYTYPVALTVEPTLSTEGEGGVPTEFALEQNYPNPFAGSTTLKYALPEAAHVRIDVYDATGRLVATLVDEEQAASYHEVQWDAQGLAAGVYLYRIQAGSFSRTLKMVHMH